jgi:catechol 2,3-dioxygenase-like lactoylglutathione lyase family enzyme
VNRPPVHHVGYVVDDIPAAVDWAVSALGAGPFFLIDHLPFDSVTFQGEPAAYDHSSAFGQWGPLKLELTVVHDAHPAGLADALGGPPGRVGHIAWVVTDVDAESSALAAAGAPAFHEGRAGPVRAVWHDARATLGHHIEILQDCVEIQAFYELMRSSAEGWDGSEPLREAPVGP